MTLAMHMPKKVFVTQLEAQDEEKLDQLKSVITRVILYYLNAMIVTILTPISLLAA
jgi:hypothetical protein